MEVTVKLGGQVFRFGPHCERDTDTIMQDYPNPLDATWRQMHLAASRAEPGLSFDAFMERWHKAAARGATLAPLLHAMNRAYASDYDNDATVN